MATATSLITAEEYAKLPDNGRPTELVNGEVVPMNLPAPRHGQICLKVGLLIGNFVDQHGRGHLVGNDAGIVTQRAPDTVRGADLAFYSYARVPPGRLPPGYLPVAPDAAFEVRSPSDRWADIHLKVGEYLWAGVTVVCVFDEQTDSAHIFYGDQAPRVLAADDELTLPGVLDGFRERVGRFFE